MTTAERYPVGEPARDRCCYGRLLCLRCDKAGIVLLLPDWQLTRDAQMWLTFGQEVLRNGTR